MFYYFGSKERLSAKYPSPTRRTIIEPFAATVLSQPALERPAGHPVELSL